jgi:hypothetical protein
MHMLIATHTTSREAVNHTTCLCSPGTLGETAGEPIGRGGRTASLVPGTRAGLKRRSQSAQEEPTPVPVAKAMGQVRPVNEGRCK